MSTMWPRQVLLLSTLVTLVSYPSGWSLRILYSEGLEAIVRPMSTMMIIVLLRSITATGSPCLTKRLWSWNVVSEIESGVD
jgi:hypothetical protein